MEIKTNVSGNKLEIKLSGRLDTLTAPELEKEIDNNLSDEIKDVEFDFSELEYVSSAGLRVMLMTKKKLNGNSPVILNANQSVKDVFEITGFSEFLDIR